VVVVEVVVALHQVVEWESLREVQLKTEVVVREEPEAERASVVKGVEEDPECRVSVLSTTGLVVVVVAVVVAGTSVRDPLRRTMIVEVVVAVAVVVRSMLEKVIVHSRCPGTREA